MKNKRNNVREFLLTFFKDIPESKQEIEKSVDDFVLVRYFDGNLGSLNVMVFTKESRQRQKGFII